MEISIYAILIWITAILIVSLDFVILVGSKNLSSRVFVALTYITAIWVASQGFLVSTTLPHFADLLIRVQYVLGISIALGFYHFSVIYPYDNKSSRLSVFISILLILGFAYAYLLTQLMNTGVHEIGGNGRWAWDFGPAHWIFDFCFVGIWAIALERLFRSFRRASGVVRVNLGNMFWALFIGIIPPTAANIVLPSFGYFSINWTGPISSAIWIFIIAYSIIRYRQMNVQSVITEMLAIGMTIIFFINIFIGIVPNIWMRSAAFIIFITLAYYLVKISLEDAKQKLLLSDLNLHLEQKVAEQTIQIRKSYDLERKARRDLEKLNETKDQFIIITQHHLRTPVTGIRWQLDEIIKGSYGAASSTVLRAISDADAAAKRLTRIVDDFLSITELKVGSSILKVEKTSLLPLLRDALDELHIDIDQKHLTISYSKDVENWPHVSVDASKIREVLLIILENAVKYNYENGSIVISARETDGKYLVVFTSTGVGIRTEERAKLFSNLFYRSDAARKANPIGMGVGLTVARAILRAHHGDLIFYSEGENKGAQVTLTLPIRRDED